MIVLNVDLSSASFHKKQVMKIYSSDMERNHIFVIKKMSLREIFRSICINLTSNEAEDLSTILTNINTSLVRGLLT
jgi:hypothetical protein